MKIDCQRNHCAENGCSTCGGYGYIIEQGSCICGKEYWVRPGAYTAYVGKKFKTFDGLTLVVGEDMATTCEECAE